MRVIERVGDRPQQCDDTERFVALAGAEYLVEGPAGDHLGHEIRTSTVVSQLVQPRDCLVLERYVRTQLEQEATREAYVARNVGLDGSNRDAPVQPRMLSLVHRSEAVCLELPQQPVAAHVVAVALDLGPGAVPVRAFLSHET